MIKPLACTVDDHVFDAVKNLCGEDVALQLCYSDEETYEEIHKVVQTILGGYPMGIAVKEVVH